MASNVYVGNLTFNTTSADLQALFGAHGEVKKAQVITDRETGRSRGFGFVEMATSEAAEAAISSLNGREVDGRALAVVCVALSIGLIGTAAVQGHDSADDVANKGKPAIALADGPVALGPGCADPYSPKASRASPKALVTVMVASRSLALRPPSTISEAATITTVKITAAISQSTQGSMKRIIPSARTRRPTGARRRR